MNNSHAQHDPRFDLDGGQWDALRENFDDEVNGLGEDFAIACNVESDDHVHVRRVGRAGSGLGGRVAVLTHGRTGHAIVYVAAPQARALAAHLLNVADDLDGTARLNFIEHAEDEVVPAPQTPNVAGLLVGLAALPAVAIARRVLKK